MSLSIDRNYSMSSPKVATSRELDEFEVEGSRTWFAGMEIQDNCFEEGTDNSELLAPVIRITEDKEEDSLQSEMKNDTHEAVMCFADSSGLPVPPWTFCGHGGREGDCYEYGSNIAYKTLYEGIDLSALNHCADQWTPQPSSFLAQLQEVSIETESRVIPPEREN